jgi:hypothetical protein
MGATEVEAMNSPPENQQPRNGFSSGRKHPPNGLSPYASAVLEGLLYIIFGLIFLFFFKPLMAVVCAITCIVVFVVLRKRIWRKK